MNPIRRLEQSVIDKIAAGEVVHRPASALKELLENALDAGATQINVVLQAGGMKLLQIQDNGSGIRPQDLKLLCERFTTSKLTTFEDLSSISSFGFRGEALSSISHVSHLSVVTKTAESACAYKASFKDGKMNEYTPEQCAGVVGTLFKIEDLFYNSTIRQKYLSNANLEYSKCLEVMSRYSLHYPQVGFMLRKQGQSRSDLQTRVTQSSLDTIKLVFGSKIARELLSFEWELPNETQGCSDVHTKVSVKGYISNANFSLRSQTLILFINHRLVQSDKIKRAVQQVYSDLLPKQAHPWVYLSLEVPSQDIDVNIHPTKHQVSFLYEVEVCELLQEAIESRLAESCESRTFYTQTRITTASQSERDEEGSGESVDVEGEEEIGKHQVDKESSSVSKKQVMRPCHLVRNNASDSSGTLLAYFQHPDKPVLVPGRKRKVAVEGVADTCLTSINSLKSQLQVHGDDKLHEIFRNHVFVGVADDDNILIQYETGLYLVNVPLSMNGLIYETVLQNFGKFAELQLSTPLSLTDMIRMSLDCSESQWEEQDGDKDHISRYLSDLLSQKSAMLKEYFGISIDNGMLLGLPLLFQGYTPALLRIPIFLLRLSTEVDWEHEKQCFAGISQELGNFYQLYPQQYYCPNKQQEPDRKWTLEFIISPLLRTWSCPSSSVLDGGVVVKIASLDKLYRIFERC